jgi:hypothetical protein
MPLWSIMKLLLYAMNGSIVWTEVEDYQETASVTQSPNQRQQPLLWCLEDTDEDFTRALALSHNVLDFVFSIIGLIVNIITLVAQIRYRSLRKGCLIFLLISTVSYIVASVSDIAFAALSGNRTVHSVSNAMLALFVCKIVSIGTVAWNVFAISVDKFISLFWPLQYQVLVTPRRRNVAIAAILCLEAVSGILICFSVHHDRIVCAGDVPSSVLSEEVGVAFYLLIVVGASVMYGRVLQLALRQRQAISSHTEHAHSYRGVGLILAVITSFIVCYLPYQSLLIVSRQVHMSAEKEGLFKVAFVHLWQLNYFVDNFIYGLLNSDFRVAYKSVSEAVTILRH